MRFAPALVYSSPAAKVPVAVAGSYIAVPRLGSVSIVSVREAFQDCVGVLRGVVSRL